MHQDVLYDFKADLTGMVTGHFAYETFRLLDTSPTTWTLRLLDISPTGQFAYETVRLLDTSPTTWTFRLHDISPPIKLLDRHNLRLCPPKFKWLTWSPFYVV